MKNCKRRKRRSLFVFSVLIIIFSALFISALIANKSIVTTELTVTDKELPESFCGFRIAQVSDLHNDELGKDNVRTVKAIKDAKPDIIVITGDIISSYDQKDIDIALSFVEDIIDTAPCYYVSGNHESRIDKYPEFADKLSDLGVIILDDEKTVIERNGEAIDLIGLRDPSFYAYTDTKKLMQSKLDALVGESFSILLSHRPEYIDIYSKAGCDLVLSGHVHGGQFRLPLIGGLYGPGQGFFPKYDSGLYRKGDTQMYVSRGLGNSVFPLRINNRPELVVITLDN